MKTQPAATAIRDELAAELAAAGITARVTIDPTDAAPALDSGTATVVVVNPPTLEFVTWHQTRAEWPVWVIAGPPTDHPTAWAALDDALPIVVRVLEAETAQPNAFTDGQGHSYPAYLITTTTDHEE